PGQRCDYAWHLPRDLDRDADLGCDGLQRQFKRQRKPDHYGGGYDGPDDWRGRGQRHHPVSEHAELHTADRLGHLRRGHGEPGQRCDHARHLPRYLDRDPDLGRDGLQRQPFDHGQPDHYGGGYDAADDWVGGGQRHHPMSEHAELHATVCLGHLRRGHGEPGQRCDHARHLPRDLDRDPDLGRDGLQRQLNRQRKPDHYGGGYDGPDDWRGRGQRHHPVSEHAELHTADRL